MSSHIRYSHLEIVMDDTAVRVENLSKRYRIGGPQARYRTMRETLVDIAMAPARRLRRLGRPAPPEETIWALKDVSFEVKHGEVMGIIGRNGAGKTTLLKILSRITEPTEGYAEINGRVGSLLEVGTGFHPELTGRENIYLNGAILGMKRAEIDQKFDEIVAFSEIEKFLDTPVKRYSSGMYVRLAFSVAAHLKPEILLVDEVLAVGDAAFQKKCLGKMGDVAGEGRTVLFVSHNMAAINTLCDRAVLLESGQVAIEGVSDEVVHRYLQTGAQRGEAVFGPETVRSGSGRARYIRSRLLDSKGRVAAAVPMGDSVTVELEFQCFETIGRPVFAVRLLTPMSLGLAGWGTNVTYGEMPAASRGGVIRLHIERLDLLPGVYNLALGLFNGHEQLDHIDNAIELEMTSYPVYPTGKIPSSKLALIFAPCSWTYDYD
jgi:lipopolysaccharide transport system ATP-binding protein